MGGIETHSAESHGTAALVRERIKNGGERLWRLDDFRDLPFDAVAQTLSRLARAGQVERLSKGVYYHTRETTLGRSRPNPANIQKLAAKRSTIFPAGLAAASLLGFTTQTARRSEMATSALSLPRKLVGTETIVHTRRPEAWANLPEEDAALLDFLRRGGDTSELSPSETTGKTIELLSAPGRLERLLKISSTEPPRVRAILGAFGEQLGHSKAALSQLKASLNPFTRFDFGAFTELAHARNWQAKERRPA